MNHREKKQKHIYPFLLAVIILFSTSFLAGMGFLNFKTNYQEIYNQILLELVEESVESIETSLNFGKTLENYYGMDEILDKDKTQMGESHEVFILDAERDFLYTSVTDEKLFAEIEAAVMGREFEYAIDSYEESAQGNVIGNRNYLIHTIVREEQQIGWFVVSYDKKVIWQKLQPVAQEIACETLYCILGILVLSAIGSLLVCRFSIFQKQKKYLTTLMPLLLLLTGILVQSIWSLNTYQQSYNESMLNGADEIVERLGQSLFELTKQGVDLKDVQGVTSYLEEKAEGIPILRNLKISDGVISGEEQNGWDTSLLIRYPLDNQTLTLEAELSSQYINEKLMQIVLILIPTLIILIIFILELMRLPGLVVYRMSEKFHTECGEGYLQVSNSLRISGFLCSTAEYICIPYAAMLIRDWNVPVLGLSVGMTAALPLSLEGLAQMAAMLLLPKYIKKINIRTTLVVSAAAMAGCNLLAFFADNAMEIILLRGAAGIAYAGFKQVSNYLITRGYHTSLERSRNLSQDNAGLLAGVTCGAGLGAVLCATVGYSMTFLVSAFVVAAYLVVTFCVVPWEMLSKKQAAQEEKSRQHQRKNILRMIFSAEFFKYVLLIGIPLNIGVQLCVTLIPGICQNQNISTVLLSYCYIVNGIAGIYIGPNLVNAAKKRFGIRRSIGIAFALTGISIFILELPAIVTALLAASTVLGFLDGFATPLSTDEFLELGIVKRSISEASALILSVVISYVLLTAAPVAAELMLMETPFVISSRAIAAIFYLIATIFLVI